MKIPSIRRKLCLLNQDDMRIKDKYKEYHLISRNCTMRLTQAAHVIICIQFLNAFVATNCKYGGKSHQNNGEVSGMNWPDQEDVQHYPAQGGDNLPGRTGGDTNKHHRGIAEHQNLNKRNWQRVVDNCQNKILEYLVIFSIFLGLSFTCVY